MSHLNTQAIFRCRLSDTINLAACLSLLNSNKCPGDMRELVEFCLTCDTLRLSAADELWRTPWLPELGYEHCAAGANSVTPHQPPNAEIPKYALVRAVTWGSTPDGALPVFEPNLSSNFGHKCHFNDDRPHLNTLKPIVAFRVDKAVYILGKGQQINEKLGNMWI
jgi:hypothetical protein